MLRTIDVPNFGIITAEDDVVVNIKLTNLEYESEVHFFMDLLPEIAKDYNIELMSLQYWVAANCLMADLIID